MHDPLPQAFPQAKHQAAHRITQLALHPAHPVLRTAKKALLLAALLAVAPTAAATEVLELAPAPQPAGCYVDESEWLAMADAAVAASQALPPPAMLSMVPEPPVYIMLLIGVGLLGLAARRRTIPPVFTTE